ncbi:MAG: hypothetical protein LUD02_04045 [Tannerellaceae bacterium]|nr:hypothetical protein [Tannerellaceae bacterium]
MLPAFSVPANNSVILTQTISSLYHAVNSSVKWKEATGSYTYRAQVLWDKNRRLVGTNMLSLGTHSITNGGSGFIVSFSGLDAGGACCIIRLKRASGGVTKYMMCLYVVP